MSGETSDISQFCKQEWFEWVMFWDETAPFLDDVLKLGHFLGSSIDIVQAMTAKIVRENGQVLHRSYRLLTLDKIADKDGSDAQEHFVARVCEKMVSWIQPRELYDIELENTTQYYPYKDGTQNK